MTPEKIAAFKVDRAGWGPGPWDEEPDRLDFRHAGFPCLALRSPSGGNWCGYVGVPSSHPDYQRSMDDVDVEVHGGLTYASECDGERICHVPEPGESDDVFWFGFDCHHSWDIAPAFKMWMRAYSHIEHEPLMSYKDLQYVRKEIEQLAEQLAARD